MEPLAMSKRATVTFHTSPEVKARLDRLATITRRSKSYLTNEAVERYLAQEEEFVAGVLKGIEQADRGETLSGDEVRQHLHQHIDQMASPIGK